MARLRLAVLGIAGAWALLSAVPAEGHKLSCNKTRLFAAEFTVDRFAHPPEPDRTEAWLDSCLGGRTTEDRRGKKHRHAISWRVIAQNWRLDYLGEGTGWYLAHHCIHYIRIDQGKGELIGLEIGKAKCTDYIPSDA